METIKSITIFLLIVTLFALLIWKGQRPQRETRIIYDTIVKTIEAKPIVVEKVKTKVKYIRDTIICEKPFVAELDTISSGDTIVAQFYFPEKEISLRITRAADTLRIPTPIAKVESKQTNWWEKPLFFLSGLALGWLVFKK